MGANEDSGKRNLKSGTPKKPFIYYYFLVILAVMVLNALVFPMMEHSVEVPYSEFLKELDAGNVKDVYVSNGESQIQFTKKDQKQWNVSYKTGPIPGDDLVKRLQNADVENFTGEIQTKASPLLSFLMSWVAPILMFVVIGNIMGRMLSKRMGGSNAMTFGKSNAKIYAENETGITFADVAGEEEAKDALKEIVDFLHNPQKYADIGANLPKGALLVGPPGTGKTLLAKARNHLHKPQRKLTSHLEALLHGAGNILLPIRFFGIIKTDQRIIFGYSLPHFLQGFHDQPIDDVVAADDSGAFRDALQKSFNGTDIAFVVGFVRNTPLDVIIVQFQTTISHRFRHALKLFDTLIVIIHEYPGDIAVTGIHQAPDQLMGTFDVIDRYAGAAQVPIEVVVEYHRDLTSVKLLVAVKIWAEDARFDTIHDETVKILMYHSLQTTAFVAELVVSQKYMQIHLFLRQNAAHALDQPGVCARILTL